MCTFVEKTSLGFNRPKPTAAGFSLVEILVASSIGAIFGSLVFQGIALATKIQSLAIQKSEAAAWVRNDLENLRRQAADLAFNINLCQPTNPEGGWAAALGQVLEADRDLQLPTLNMVSTTGRTFQLARRAEISSLPHNILRLSYQVQPTSSIGSTGSIYQFYTEVIPDAAFQCP
jgi:prepilin-type N-terminal cleavage/methylation domain-containing protein